MGSKKTLSRYLETIAWGAIFIWWGVSELIGSDGILLVGIGVILLGVNAIRALRGIPTRRLSITLGILALIWGGLELTETALHLPFELPVFAVLLIVLGIIWLVPALIHMRKAGLGELG